MLALASGAIGGLVFYKPIINTLGEMFNNSPRLLFTLTSAITLYFTGKKAVKYANNTNLVVNFKTTIVNNLWGMWYGIVIGVCTMILFKASRFSFCGAHILHLQRFSLL